MNDTETKSALVDIKTFAAKFKKQHSALEKMHINDRLGRQAFRLKGVLGKLIALGELADEIVKTSPKPAPMKKPPAAVAAAKKVAAKGTKR